MHIFFQPTTIARENNLSSLSSAVAIKRYVSHLSTTVFSMFRKHDFEQG